MVNRSGRNVTDLAARLAPRGNSDDAPNFVLRDRDVIDQLKREATAATTQHLAGDTMLSDLERRALRDAPPELRRQLLPRQQQQQPQQQPQATRPTAHVERPVPPAPYVQPRQPSAPAASTNNLSANDRLMRTLMDISDRLKRSESERELLWREMESTRRLLDDMKDKASKSERANTQLQATLARRDRLAEELIKKQQEIQTSQKVLASQVEEALNRTQGVEERLQLTDTTSSSLMVKINDLLGDGVKLSRRLDQMTQDKTRLLRKIELVEDTLLQTQETLRAKALVLLTDQSVAARTGLPQEAIPASSINASSLHAGLPPGATMPKGGLFDKADLPQWLQLITRRPIMATTALVAGGLILGWALNGAPLPTITHTAQTQEASKLSDAATQGNKRITAADLQVDETQLLAEMQNAEQKAADSISNAATTDITTRLSPDPDLPDNIKAIENQAFGGSAEAQHDLAAIYTAGHAGVQQNYGRAIEWFTLAARSGVANARYNLGVLYHQGLGTKQDVTKAISYYNAAAFLGHPEALYNLGIAALAGEGMPQSHAASIMYFTRAANLGLVEAAFNLGRMQEDIVSDATDKDAALNAQSTDDAIFWYKLAADNGHDNAKAALNALASRLGLKQDAINARYARAAMTHPEAIKALGSGVTASGANAEPQTAAEAAAQVEKAVPKAAAAVKPGTKTVAKTAPAPAPAIDTVRLPEQSEAETKAQQSVAIISQIQEQLARQGLFKGDADGQLSAETQDAISRYQKQNGLRVTGEPSEDLLVNMLAREFAIDVQQ